MIMIILWAYDSLLRVVGNPRVRNQLRLSVDAVGQLQ